MGQSGEDVGANEDADQARKGACKSSNSPDMLLCATEGDRAHTLNVQHLEWRWAPAGQCLWYRSLSIPLCILEGASPDEY